MSLRGLASARPSARIAHGAASCSKPSISAISLPAAKMARYICRRISMPSATRRHQRFAGNG